MIRAYGLKHHANAGKIAEISRVIPAYRDLAGHLASIQWARFFMSGQFNKDHDVKMVPTKLSARYKQCCQYQVVGILDSFISNRKNDFVETVRGSLLTDEQKHKLFIVNSCRLWYTTIPFSHLKSKHEIGTDVLKLARRIMKHVLSRHHKPRMGAINMALDAKTALTSETVKGKASSFDYWVRVSTLSKGHPVYIPLTGNEYYNSIAGKRNNFIQINLSRDNEISFSFIKDVPDGADTYCPLTPVMSLDIGLSTLVASDKGDLWGRDFFSVLKNYDRLITELAANRQRQGLPVRSPRYDNITRKLRDYMKNEINRVLNRAVSIRKPAEIVIERLDFRSPNLSRRMNRLISRFGKSLFKMKLDSLSSELGMQITETNPAYTSQQCSVCGYVARDNRKTRSSFKCTCCKSELHADVNAARNHLARSSDEVIDVYKSTESVLLILTDRFLSNAERIKRHHSMAPGLLSLNPYFAGPSAQPKGFS